MHTHENDTHESALPTIGEAARALMLANRTITQMTDGFIDPAPAASALHALLWTITAHLEDVSIRRVAVQINEALNPTRGDDDLV